jgi:hypothetical protein
VRPVKGRVVLFWCGKRSWEKWGKSVNSKPRTAADIVSASLPVPDIAKRVVQTGEKVKFFSGALFVTRGDFEVGSFILTERRYLFLRNVGYKEQDLASINGVRVYYDYIVGLISAGLSGVSSGGVHVIEISTGVGVEGFNDSIALIPDDEDLTKSVAEALLELKDKTVSQILAQKAESVGKVEAVSSPHPVDRVKEIHYVVKIPCRYCGVLNDQLGSKCESCGAPLR